MKTISVIVPVYNTADYLSKCVDSILNQTCKPLEIILVDDGSSDGSERICDEYAARYPQIVRAVHQRNQGPSAARNMGMEQAKGEVYSFIDSDDYIEPDMFACLSELMEREGAQIAAGEMLVEEPDGRTYCRGQSNVELVWDTEEALVELLSYRYLYASFCTALFSRDVMGELRFPVGIKCEDYWLQPQVFGSAAKVAYTARAFYHYFQRGASRSRSQDISLIPLEASARHLEYYRRHFPDIAWAAEADCAVARMSIYTKYIRNRVDCPPELLKKLRKGYGAYIASVLRSRLPTIKKAQALMFWIFPGIYKLVIARTEHR